MFKCSQIVYHFIIKLRHIQTFGSCSNKKRLALHNVGINFSAKLLQLAFDQGSSR